MTQHRLCFIQHINCGLQAGNPVCPKCGMDERIVYPSEADREGAVTAARARYWEAHARALEAAQPQEPVVSLPLVTPPSQSSDSKLNPAAAWPFPTSAASADAATGDVKKSALASSGSELPKILTAGAVSVAANAVLGIEGWPRYVVTIVCFAVVYGLWSLVKGSSQQDQ